MLPKWFATRFEYSLPRAASFRRHCRKELAALISDSSGAAGVTLGISLVVLMGFVGLAVESSNWLVIRRTMQGAADSAAFSAAVALGQSEPIASYTSEATSVAATYGYANGTNGVTVTVTSPPTSGSYADNTSAVQVTISQPQTVRFASLFLSSPPTITATAIAITGATGTGCVLALDRADVEDIVDVGTTNLNLVHPAPPDVSLCNPLQPALLDLRQR